MKRLRRVTEAEVIAEFLKNEFYQEEFQNDRDLFEHLVLDADVTNEADNAVRRALLFRRRGHMWRELPPDTQWWEVAIEPCDLDHIRVFPRAHWRKISNGSFLLSEIVKQIRSGRVPPAARSFISKIQSLSYRLRADSELSSVMLIGIDERHPLTILEGNHRLTAALLASPTLLHTRFRVICGFSPRMTQSCWYETNFANLWRYAKNRLRNFRDREAEVARVANAAAVGMNGSHAAVHESEWSSIKPELKQS
jgi:hypothetical protein